MSCGFIPNALLGIPSVNSGQFRSNQMLSSDRSQDLALWDFGGLNCFVQTSMYVSWSCTEASEGPAFYLSTYFEGCWTKQWNQKIDPMHFSSKV